MRMNKRLGRKKIRGGLPPLFKTKADVIEPNAVGIKTFATRSEYSNKLRNEVQNLPEFCLLFADFVFCPFAIFDVGRDPIPLDDVSIFISEGHSAVQLPAILPIRTAGNDPLFYKPSRINPLPPIILMSLT